MSRSSMLDKVKAMAIEPMRRTIEELDAEIHSMRSAENSLFEIERHSKDRLLNAAFRLSQDKKFYNTDYKRLSLEPLGWTTGVRHPRPVFALYNISDPVMAFASDRGLYRPQNFPGALSRMYRPVIDNLRRQSGRDTITITSSFNGIIPMEVRPKIKEALELFKVESNYGQVIDHVYIMAEVTHWDTSVEVKPRPPRVWVDPLVVGWDGMDLWLVTSFDMTPLEQYVTKEFPALTPPQHLTLPEGRRR